MKTWRRDKNLIFEDLEGLIIQDYEANSPRKLKTLVRHLATLRNYFQFLRASEITPEVVQRYAAARRKGFVRGAIINGELKVLNQMLMLSGAAKPIAEKQAPNRNLSNRALLLPLARPDVTALEQVPHTG